MILKTESKAFNHEKHEKSRKDQYSFTMKCMKVVKTNLGAPVV